MREVKAFRTERQLANTQNSAQQHKEQMKAIMADTADAFAYIQTALWSKPSRMAATVWAQQRDELGAIR